MRVTHARARPRVYVRARNLLTLLAAPGGTGSYRWHLAADTWELGGLELDGRRSGAAKKVAASASSLSAAAADRAAMCLLFASATACAS